MEFLIVTGLSGAGKSRASVILEDLGYYCVDNIPPDMIPVLAEICSAGGPRYEKTAVVTDVRVLAKEGTPSADAILAALDKLDERGIPCSVMFLEASDEVLLRRYKETRRRHPLAEGGRPLPEALRLERRILAPVRERADYLVDTTATSASGLRDYIVSLFDREGKGDMLIHVISFGYKYGIPPESDFVFDVRFLPNPFYVPELRKLSGSDERVAEYVESFDATRSFEKMMFSLADFLIPQFDAEGRATLVFAVGCTGGQHRSVTMAERLGEHVRSLGRTAVVFHRDAEKNISEIKEREKP